MQKRIYFENLNGLRFPCFLSVFLFHIFRVVSDSFEANPMFYFLKNDLFGNGNLGVNFFFVLSGFLITYLLIEEKILNKQISIPKFWLRRVLRIWPLFF
jgi:peptidoglycan/LPS O-acetylase OafA/YrhL